MIQELFFVPHSLNRSSNQMNTSVSLQYDTRTESLQLVDIHGVRKTISIDTTPELTTEDIIGVVTEDYIKSLGFTSVTDIPFPEYSTGFGLGKQDGENGDATFFVKKDEISGLIVDTLSTADASTNIKDIINTDYISGLGFTLESEDDDTLYFGDNTTINLTVVDDKNTFSINAEWLSGYVQDELISLGYVPHDNDTLYHGDDESINLTVTDETNIFSVNTTWLSGFLGTYLDENQYLNEQEKPLTYAAGEGIAITVDPVENTNVISFAAHIPVYNAGSGISVTADGEDFIVALTAYIPTGLSDWDAADTSAYIRNQNFALTSDLTGYFGSENIELYKDNINQLNKFRINTTWLNNWIEDKHYITSYVNSTYFAGDGLNLTDNTNTFSIDTTWLRETTLGNIPTYMASEDGYNAVRTIISKDYLTGIGMISQELDKDTLFVNGDGLDLTSTTFSVNTTWLTNKMSSFVDTNITSTWISGIGVNIYDTKYRAADTSLYFEVISNNPNDVTVAVNSGWLTGVISYYNSVYGIVGGEQYEAGNGIGIDIIQGTAKRSISLTAQIPTGLASWDSTVNTNYISNLGFALANNVPVYEGVTNGGVNIQFGNVVGQNKYNVSVDTTWLSGWLDTNGYSTKDKFLKSAEVIKAVELNGVIYEYSTYHDDNIIEIPENVKALLRALIDDSTNYDTCKEEKYENAWIKYLKLTFATTDNSTETDQENVVYLCINDLFDSYTEGEGISVDQGHNKINLKLDPTTENYLTVGENGLKLDGIQSAINFATESKVDKEEGKSLIANTQITRLATVDNYDDTEVKSDINGINGTILTLLDKIAILQEQLNNIKFAAAETVVTIEGGKVNEPDEDVIISVPETQTTNTTITGKSILVKDYTYEDSYVKFTATEDVDISNLDNSGTLPKSVSNAQVNINTEGYVKITDSELNQNGYNAIEIGLSKPSKSIVIDGVTFGGNLTNNAISIHDTEDGAVVTISNCTFVNCSNPIRLSNKSNVHVTVNIVNCEFTQWEAGMYAGMLFCQDFTSTTNEAALENNLFAPEKVTINVVNCTHAGQKIMFSDPSEVCATGDDNQIFYVYYNKGGLIAYGDGSRFPRITVS